MTAASPPSGLTAVLDVGKTALKVRLVDESGGVVAGLETPARGRPGPPYPSLDADAPVAFLVDSLRQLGRAASVDAIVPVTHGAAAAMVRGDELALPVIDYEFCGPEETARDYHAPPFAETLSPPLAAGLNLGRQLHYLERRFPDRFGAATEILLYPQYLAFRLSGRKVSEVTSLGCHTDLWAPRNRRFSSLALTRGWADRFPPVVPAWTDLGPVRPEIARAAGLPRHCAVFAGIHDSNAAYLAASSGRKPPFAVVSTGTWVVCLVAGGALDRLDPSAEMLANVDVHGQPVATARFMGGRRLALMATDADGRADATLLAALGASDLAAVVASGALPLPDAFGKARSVAAGERVVEGPEPADPRRRAALALLQAVLTTDLCLDRLEARGPVIVEGRFVRTPPFAAALAALRPDGEVLVSDESGAAAGAAMIARAADRPSAARASLAAPADVPGLESYRDRWRARASDGERRGRHRPSATLPLK